VREMLDSLLADCRLHALKLDCARGLDGVPRLAAANGAACQRKFVALTPRLGEHLASLADRFFSRPIGVPKARARILDTHQYDRK